MRKSASSFWAVALATSLCLTSSASAELIYGIAAVGNATALVTWDSSSPGDLESSAFMTGLQSNETIVGIDFRPSTGQLYGLGSSSRLYTISTSGVAAQVGGPGSFSPALNGFNFGFGFNPVIDRIRVVSETNSNRVLNPNDGSAATATNLFYGPADPNFGVDPNVVHSAYSNDFDGAVTTQLYGIDSGLNILVTQANSAGTLGAVGPLGVDIGAVGGFDISGVTGVAYATLLPAGSSVSQLYSISLLTGAATNLGVIDGGLIITAMAVAIPEPSTVALAFGALVAGVFVRRRRS